MDMKINQRDVLLSFSNLTEQIETAPGNAARTDLSAQDGRMESVKEACGVFGVFAPGIDVAELVFDGLFALQHRGQESAGMAVSDGELVTVVKDMGLVTSVFDQRTLSSLQGR